VYINLFLNISKQQESCNNKQDHRLHVIT